MRAAATKTVLVANVIRFIMSVIPSWSRRRSLPRIRLNGDGGLELLAVRYRGGQTADRVRH